jgi:hypothetical protein
MAEFAIELRNSQVSPATYEFRRVSFRYLPVVFSSAQPTMMPRQNISTSKMQKLLSRGSGLSNVLPSRKSWRGMT